ncbi:unnamed protein product, partial [Rotaria sp. Silwood1]
MDLPVASKGSFGGQYDRISPFVIDIRRNLKLKPEELPSKKPDVIPMLVEEAARGIIEEGKYIGKERQAEKLAKILREQKNKGIKESEQIFNYKEMAKHRDEYRSFEAFTSCSRNREKTEELGNTLFIME